MLDLAIKSSSLVSHLPEIQMFVAPQECAACYR